MKVIFLTLTLLLTGCANQLPYAKVGIGYKFQEANIKWITKGVVNYNSPISARFELGMETDQISYGISHHSQWFVGYPIDNKGEYYKTEIFADYKFQF